MKKHYSVILTVVCLCMVLAMSACGHKDNALKWSVSMSDTTWENMNTKYSGFAKKAEFLAEAEYYVTAISAFIGKEDWYKAYQEKHGEDYACNIEYRITTTQVSHVEGGYMAYLTLIPIVYLYEPWFECNMAPTAHETTHIIAPFYSSLSLREGLANYCHNRFAKNPTIMSWGLDAHIFANAFRLSFPKDFETVASDIGTKQVVSEYTQDDMRQIFYGLSTSFSTYLIDTYGIENFMKLYESKDLLNDYNSYCGKSYDDIKKNWCAMLEAYPGSMTYEEVEAYVGNLLSEHNYNKS